MKKIKKIKKLNIVVKKQKNEMLTMQNEYENEMNASQETIIDTVSNALQNNNENNESEQKNNYTQDEDEIKKGEKLSTENNKIKFIKKTVRSTPTTEGSPLISDMCSYRAVRFEYDETNTICFQIQQILGHSQKIKGHNNLKKILQTIITRRSNK